MVKGFGFLIAAFIATLAASPPAQAQRNQPLFEDHSELEITIEGPIGALVSRAEDSTDPYPATLTIAGANTRYEMEVAARGISRRTLGICNFPPLRLDLRRGAMRGTVFQGQNRLKLVTRCRTGQQYDQINAREYLAYRLYNALTPLSYRVRPVRVTFRDSERNGREHVQQAFLIEDVDDVARRNGLVEIDVPAGALSADNLHRQAATRYALFQYMIGNLDWDMVTARAGEDCCHNSRVLGPTQNTRSNLIPAPYDFDFSGLVNAPYAVPPAQVSVSSVRTRVYRGYCRFNEEVPVVIAEVLSRRDAVNDVIANEARLNSASRSAVQRYVDEFFSLIGNPEAVDRQIIRRCRG